MEMFNCKAIALGQSVASTIIQMEVGLRQFPSKGAHWACCGIQKYKNVKDFQRVLQSVLLINSKVEQSIMLEQ